jgi:hypothetical protein
VVFVPAPFNRGTSSLLTTREHARLLGSQQPAALLTPGMDVCTDLSVLHVVACFILSYRKLLEKLRHAKWIFLGLLGKGLLSTCLKFLALSLVRVPALKGGAAVLLMIYGLLNDDSPPDRTGAERTRLCFCGQAPFFFRRQTIIYQGRLWTQIGIAGEIRRDVRRSCIAGGPPVEMPHQPKLRPATNANHVTESQVSARGGGRSLLLSFGHVSLHARPSFQPSLRIIHSMAAAADVIPSYRIASFQLIVCQRFT